MMLSHISLARKSPASFHLREFSRKPISNFDRQCLLPADTLRISVFRNFGHGIRLRDSGRSKRGILYPDRVSVGSAGGSGGSGGSDDNNSGGGGHGGGDSGNNWSFLSWYLGLLSKYPVLTKAVTSAILTLVGDVICQLAIDQAPSLDKKRTFVFTLLGLVLVGPTLHFWYLQLSKMVTLSGVSGVVLRLLVDQFIFSPIFIGVFLSALVTLEGKPSQAMPMLQQEWFSSVIANWQLWIPFQFLNFRFVPQQFQVLAANVVAVAWNVILSFKAHKEVTQ